MTDATALAKRALELADKATPGPWEIRLAQKNSYLIGSDNTYVCGTPVIVNDPSSQFIVESINIIPELATAYLELKAAHDKAITLLNEFDSADGFAGIGNVPIELREKLWDFLEKEEAGE